jgi:hypothetical protein
MLRPSSGLRNGWSRCRHCAVWLRPRESRSWTSPPATTPIGSACSAQSPVVTIARTATLIFWSISARKGSRSAHPWRIHRPVSRSDEQRVQDILDASDQILEVVRDGRAAWEKDRFRQLAVERLLKIIGGSANSLSDNFRAVPRHSVARHHRSASSHHGETCR